MYTITLAANPTEGGTVEGAGDYYYAVPATVTATPKPGYEFVKQFTFTVLESLTLTANFEKTILTVTVAVNDTTLGRASGAGQYQRNATVQVRAVPNSGYSFENWTIGGVVVSTNPAYHFVITEDTDLVANFTALDFDTYAATLWENTFMLNKLLLGEEGYEVTGCKWFKSGREEKNTNTVDEFSYSAGPNKTDLLEPAPTYYMFRITTEDGRTLYSTKKIMNYYDLAPGAKSNKLFVYPNPVASGATFTVEGVVEDSPIFVYNQFGLCVSYTPAPGTSIVTLNLDLPVGVYLIRSENKTEKIVITK
ncbi:MAG: T9SS type A sorting domain-containing protein [Bacteroidetes bacterium]|nr:T9SS type A sorting domain-containing protein [Bacteroidota bacterium]MCL2302794.1 T9SS type A sorting domain-containing protein [Lentimicrobiaceae bacterium]